MRLSLRLNLSLVAGVTIVSLGIALYQTQTERSGLKRDLERQAMVLAESLGKSATPLMAEQETADLQALVDYFENHERLAGVVVYDGQGQMLAETPDLTVRLGKQPSPMTPGAMSGNGAGQFFRINGKLMHVYELPVRFAGIVIGELAIYHDANYIQLREAALWRHVLAGLAVQTVLIVCVTLLILQWSLRRPLAKLTKWLGEVRRGSDQRSSGPVATRRLTAASARSDQARHQSARRIGGGGTRSSPARRGGIVVDAGAVSYLGANQAGPVAAIRHLQSRAL